MSHVSVKHPAHSARSVHSVNIHRAQLVTFFEVQTPKMCTQKCSSQAQMCSCQTQMCTDLHTLHTHVFLMRTSVCAPLRCTSCVDVCRGVRVRRTSCAEVFLVRTSVCTHIAHTIGTDVFVLRAHRVSKCSPDVCTFEMYIVCRCVRAVRMVGTDLFLIRTHACAHPAS